MQKAISLALMMLLLPGVAVAQEEQPAIGVAVPQWDRPACGKGYEGVHGTLAGTVISGGKERGYLLHVPDAYDGSEEWPLIFDFHGSGSTPEAEMAISGFDRFAGEEGFLLVNPKGALLESRGIHTWNIPHDPQGVDDVQFTRDLLEALSGELCVNERAVYAMGFSGGARMASELACRASDRFAAVAAVAGLRFPEGAEGDCTGGRPMPIMTFHSLDDAINPYAVGQQGAPAYWSYGVDEVLRRWVTKNGCEPGTEARLPGDVERTVYEDCAEGSAIVFYRTQDNGHSWPGSSFDFPANIGSPNPDLDASGIAVTFFRNHRLPGQ